MTLLTVPRSPGGPPCLRGVRAAEGALRAPPLRTDDQQVITAALVACGLAVVLAVQGAVSRRQHDPARRAMCRAVLQLGASLGLPVIVEGVTTPVTLALLRDMGHRYLQGFLLSRPLEADRLAGGTVLAAEALRCPPAPAVRP